MIKYIVNIVLINIGRRSSVSILPMPTFFFAVLTLKYKVLLIITKYNKL